MIQIALPQTGAAPATGFGALREGPCWLEDAALPVGETELTAAPPPDAEAGYSYRLFGLALRSEVPLPELVPVPAGPADVVIRRGPVPRQRGTGHGGGLHIVNDAPVLDMLGLRYRIEGGDTITVDADPDASLRNLRLFLLGSAMGALLHQRAILPLHANAIAAGDRAIAFAGRSGAGKSTLADAFHADGYALLSDDICAVVPDADGRFLAQPGIPRMRLWRDALERGGRSADGLDLAYDGADKYVLPLDADAVSGPLPLAAIFFLSDGENSDVPTEIAPVPPARGIEQLIANTYRGAYVPLLGDQRRHFETCVALARSVPMYALNRPWNPARIGETVRLVEEHLTAMPA